MAIKLSKYSNRWYFSKGIYTEHTIALYFPDQNLLKVINLKHLSSVIKLLLQHIDKKQITLEFAYD